jgi:hypothetical protein
MMVHSFDNVVDGGTRIVCDNGGQRESDDGKLDFTIVPYEPLCRLVRHYMNGARKYAKDNWKLLGTPDFIDRYKRSALRHLYQYINNENDEDHLSAAVFNIFALIYFEETS